MDKPLPSVSIVIPAHNEERTIEGCVRSCLSQKIKPHEIIVVNDGSTDRTREIVEEIAKEHPEVKILNFERGHSAAFARNRGAEKATGDVLVFIDADVTLLDEDFVEKVARVFVDEKIKVAGYCWRLAEPETWIERCYAARYAYLAKTKGKTVKEFTGMPYIFRREFFNEVGGFNEKIFYYEDKNMIEKVKKGGGEIFRINAYIRSNNPKTIDECLRQARYMGKGASSYNIAVKSPAEFFYPLSPLFWTVFFFSALIAFVFPYAFWVMLIMLVFEFLRHAYYSRMPIESVCWVFFLSPLRAIVVVYSFVRNRLGI